MWLARTTLPGGSFGANGKQWWWTPAATTAADFTEIPVPSNINVVDLKETAAHYDGSLFICGGWTDNMVLTPDLNFWALGIRAPTVVPTVAAGAGTITASVICYLQWYDAETDEGSPLSAASVTLSLSAQGVDWTSLPTDPQNPRVTHLRGWRSVDGSLPRLVWERQVGVASVTGDTLAVGDLGEAFTEDFEKFPRCRYGVVWRDRLVMAGDDEHPDTLYLSLVGLPERKALSLRTKSGQPITGLAIVRDTLLVGCTRSWEVVSGYTEDDLAIEISQPQIGLASHHATRLIHGNLWVPNEIGFYVTDGAGWFFVGDDIEDKFSTEYQARRDSYERSWAFHDPFDKVYGLYVGSHTDIASRNVFWTAAYDGVTALEGGRMGQPDWSYDTSSRGYACGEVLYIPNGRRGDLYLGGYNDGTIYKANNYNTSVDGYDDDASDGGNKRMVIRTGAEGFGDFGGDIAHGKRFTEIDLFLKTELNASTLNLYAGDEDAYPARNPTKTFTLSASRDLSDDDFVWQAKRVWTFGLVGCTGRRLVTEVTADSPHDEEFAGYQVSWKEGPAPRRESDVEEGGV
jgi:hypothetical protein